MVFLLGLTLSSFGFRLVIVLVYFIQLLVHRCGRLVQDVEATDICQEVSIEDKETNLLNAVTPVESLEEGKQHRPSQLETVDTIIDNLLKKKGR